MSDQTLGSIEAIASMDNWDKFNDFTREVIGLNIKEKGLAYNLKLASEELISNIIKAANDAPETKDHEVVLEISAIKHNEGNRSWLIVRTKDNGCHFDPQFEQRLPIDTEQPVSERKIGGLGLFLIQQSVEKVAYEWKEGFNIYELWVGADIDDISNK
jgi:anti-sigma regulatory factor (Ser/Thr protein kinase)